MGWRPFFYPPTFEGTRTADGWIRIKVGIKWFWTLSKPIEQSNIIGCSSFLFTHWFLLLSIFFFFFFDLSSRSFRLATWPINCLSIWRYNFSLRNASSLPSLNFVQRPERHFYLASIWNSAHFPFISVSSPTFLSTRERERETMKTFAFVGNLASNKS